MDDSIRDHVQIHKRITVDCKYVYIVLYRVDVFTLYNIYFVVYLKTFI